MAYGMQISSEIELPLAPVERLDRNSGNKTPAEVAVRIAEVPSVLHGALTRTPAFQVTPREFLFHLPCAGRFVVRDAREVCVQPAADAAPGILEPHVAHAGLAAVLHQLGRHPLHASAVVVNGGGIAFLGASMTGKSTIAAALNQRGYPSVCDDICAIHNGNGIAQVAPGTGELQLWDDAARALALDIGRAHSIHPEGLRYSFTVEQAAGVRPIPLRRLYLLQASRLEPEGFTRLSGNETFKSLYSSTYFAPNLAGLGDASVMFAAYGAISRSVPLFKWFYKPGLELLETSLDCLERHLQTEFQ